MHCLIPQTLHLYSDVYLTWVYPTLGRTPVHPNDLALPLHFTHSLKGSPESCWARGVEQSAAATWSSKLRSFRTQGSESSVVRMHQGPFPYDKHETIVPTSWCYTAIVSMLTRWGRARVADVSAVFFLIWGLDWWHEIGGIWGAWKFENISTSTWFNSGHKGEGFTQEWGVGIKLGNMIGPFLYKADANINLHCGAFYVLPSRKVSRISGLSIERITAANAPRSLYPPATQLPGPYNSGPFTRLTDVIIWLSNHLTQRAEVSDTIQSVRLWSN